MAEQDLVKVDTEQRRIERSLGRLRRVARLMDDQFELPLVRYRVGLDPIIGLIPGGGDWVTWFVSVYILLEALRLKVPLSIIVRMASVIGLDLLMGYVPGLGDVADAAFKANRRSVGMLLEYFGASYERDVPERVTVDETALTRSTSPAVVRYAVGLVIIVVLFAIAAFPIALLWWLLKG